MIWRNNQWIEVFNMVLNKYNKHVSILLGPCQYTVAQFWIYDVFAVTVLTDWKPHTNSCYKRKSRTDIFDGTSLSRWAFCLLNDAFWLGHTCCCGTRRQSAVVYTVKTSQIQSLMRPKVGWNTWNNTTCKILLFTGYFCTIFLINSQQWCHSHFNIINLLGFCIFMKMGEKYVLIRDRLHDALTWRKQGGHRQFFRIYCFILMLRFL